MTISKQIREAALYAREPWARPLSHRAFNKLWRFSDVWVGRWRSVQGRTFMLLVAEALE